MQKRAPLQEVLPKSGLVVSEKSGVSELLCKPKLLPLKSITLQKLEEMEVSLSSIN
jgi:BBSome-interacting protein 1